MQCCRREWTGRQCNSPSLWAAGKEVVGPWGRRDGRDGGKTQVQVQVQVQSQVQAQVQGAVQAASAHACAGGPRCGLDKQGGGMAQRRTTRRICTAEVALGSHTWHLPTLFHPSIPPFLHPSTRHSVTHPPVSLSGRLHVQVCSLRNGWRCWTMYIVYIVHMSTIARHTGGQRHFAVLHHIHPLVPSPPRTRTL